MPPRCFIFLSASSLGNGFSPFSSVVNSSYSCCSVYLRLMSSSVPNSAGMGKNGMMGSWSMLYISTLSRISSVFAITCGRSPNTVFISALVLNHSCFEYSIRFGSSRSLPVARQSRWSCASALSWSTKCASLVHTSFTPYSPASSIIALFAFCWSGNVSLLALILGSFTSCLCSSR